MSSLPSLFPIAIPSRFMAVAAAGAAAGAAVADGTKPGVKPDVKLVPTVSTVPPKPSSSSDCTICGEPFDRKTMIVCGKCGQWVHAPCGGVTMDHLKTMNEYRCPKCSMSGNGSNAGNGDTFSRPDMLRMIADRTVREVGEGRLTRAPEPLLPGGGRGVDETFTAKSGAVRLTFTLQITDK